MVHKHNAASHRLNSELEPAFTARLDIGPYRRTRTPAEESPAHVAYQIIHEELMLDGNSRLNLATFVTTWMEPEAEKLMAETFDKNMIDKDEYPQTAEIERRCATSLPIFSTRHLSRRQSEFRQSGRARPSCSREWR